MRCQSLQLDQEIVNFSEGLRVIGLKPHEKIALFADNSCRWLVADQGKSIDPIFVNPRNDVSLVLLFIHYLFPFRFLFPLSEL